MKTDVIARSTECDVAIPIKCPRRNLKRNVSQNTKEIATPSCEMARNDICCSVLIL